MVSYALQLVFDLKSLKIISDLSSLSLFSSCTNHANCETRKERKNRKYERTHKMCKVSVSLNDFSSCVLYIFIYVFI